MSGEHHGEESSHGGCDGCHGDSKLPQGLLVTVSGVLTGLGLAFEWTLPSQTWLATACFLLATISGGLLVFPAAWKALRARRLDMNVLMAVAVTGAWLIGQGEEAASVVFLFALSELLESWSAGRARRAIASLLKLSPETALVTDSSGKQVEKPVGELAIGTEVMVKSGSRVPVDGVIVTGNSAINQAPITGESVPVEKQPGDQVFAGTINGEGSLNVKTTKLAGDSTLARIVRLVEEAEGQKAPTQRFVDRFASYYTPAVFVAALLVATIPPLLFQQSWTDWLYRSLVLLVIACPCALVIATPVSIVSGLTALARRGVLVKGGAYLEAIGKLRALAVDKTGTITQGRPQVANIVSLQGVSEYEILAKAAAIDTHSEHPLAKAVVEEAEKRDVIFTPALDYTSRTGRGAEGRIGGHPYFVGNHRMAHELGACTEEVKARLAEVESAGLSLAVVGHMPHDGCAAQALGIIAIGDAIRPETREALRLLHDAGLEKVVMLSGDNQRTASAIAQKAGIDEAIGDLLPDQKVEHVKALVSKHRYVGMIGDGVNDAPALAVASVGIAMGAIGSDTAIETADMTLMKDDLTKVAEAIVLGRRTVRIIQFNVAFALAIKAIFLVLALMGHASLWMAIVADTGATLLVILNALRLLRN